MVYSIRSGMNLPKRIPIQSHVISITPRYAETDKGGVIHHSVYPVWFEMGRTELLRAKGIAYKDLEEAQVFFVVVELHIKYHVPARYDEKLKLETNCTCVNSSKIEHAYRLIRSCDGTILAEGSSVLACVNVEGKIRRIPALIRN